MSQPRLYYIFLLTFAVLITITSAATAPPSLLWEKPFAFHDSTTFEDICPTADGGIAAVGTTTSSHKEYVTDTSEIVVLKTDADGNQLWNRTYEATGFAQASGIAATTDGGFIIIGNSHAVQSDDPSLLLLRIDSEGTPEWQRTFGRNGTFVGTSVAPARDGGYIACGWMSSRQDFNMDLYLLRISSSGEMVWEKMIGNTKSDQGNSVIEVSDGSGFAVAGWTDSTGAGSGDFYLVKTDPEGNVLWEKTYGYIGYDFGEEVREIPGGGFAIAGGTSFPIDREHPAMSLTRESMYLVRTDRDGNQLRADILGDPGKDCLARSVELSPDGGFVLAGQVMTDGADWNKYLVRTDREGLPVWEKSWGGTGFDSLYAVVRIPGGGYIAAGEQAAGPGVNVWLAGDIARFAPDEGSPGSPLTGKVTTPTTPTTLPTPVMSPPPVRWEKDYMIGDTSSASDFIATRDGGYAIAGTAVLADTPGYLGPPFPNDAFLLRLDRDGKELWNRTYGGNDGDGFESVRETADGGFILAGTTSSPPSHDADMYLVRTGADGTVLWERRFGGTGFDVLHSVSETPDGGYFVAGESDKNRTLVRQGRYLAAVDRNGAIIWENITPGGPAGSLEPVPPGGYIFSSSGPSSLVRIDRDGKTIWSKSAGMISSVRPTRDGGFIGTGILASQETGHLVMAITKFDSSGEIAWQWASPGSFGSGSDVLELGNGEFAGVGSEVDPEKIPGSRINPDLFVIRLSPAGNPLWEKRFPGAIGSSRIAAPHDGSILVLWNFNTGEDRVTKSIPSTGRTMIRLTKLGPETGATGTPGIPFGFATVAGSVVLALWYCRRKTGK